jgi:anti-sigma factor ChrR (cupin superfamily)
MTTSSARLQCERFDDVHLYAIRALPKDEIPGIEVHLSECERCRAELAALEPVRDSFVAWPRDVLRPPKPLWGRVAERIAAERDERHRTETVERPPAPVGEWREPDWNEVAPGIFTKLLATDRERHRVSMLVRLAPGVAYPAHRHAGVEELHLLEGVLIVDEKTLHPGDYLYADAGSADALVWSENGCTCVLITSTRDELG